MNKKMKKNYIIIAGVSILVLAAAYLVYNPDILGGYPPSGWIHSDSMSNEYFQEMFDDYNGTIPISVGWSVCYKEDDTTRVRLYRHMVIPDYEEEFVKEGTYNPQYTYKFEWDDCIPDYDVNDDGNVNFQDSGLVWINRAELVPYNAKYDMNCNGVIGVVDQTLTWEHRD